MASVDRWQGDKWRARWRDPNGRTLSKVFDRKVDAENHLTTVRHDILVGDYIDPRLGRQRFLEWADEWAAAQDWKATSRESWRAVRSRLAPLLGDRPLASVDRLALQGAQRALSGRYAHSTVTLTMAYAGMILRAAHASGRVRRDPTKGLRGPEGPRR